MCRWTWRAILVAAGCCNIALSTERSATAQQDPAFPPPHLSPVGTLEAAWPGNSPMPWPPPGANGHPPQYTSTLVPPNSTEVLPDVNFQQFPVVPRQDHSAPPKLKAHKDGFLQRVALTGTWLDRGNHNSVGVTETEFYLTGAIPLPSREQPMLLTPGMTMRFFDAPPAPDLPETVYDTYLQWMWLPRWNESWSGIFAVTPGVYSDFETYNGDALRITGRALLRWQMRPEELELLAGILYLDRADLSLLPAGGVIWMPTEEARLEMLFPRPKLAYRLGQDPGHSEDWVYLGGEFGGETWLVERHGAAERVTMRDWRAYLGAERKLDGGSHLRFEAGYVFYRTFEFEATASEYEPDDAWMVRLGGAY